VPAFGDGSRDLPIAGELVDTDRARIRVLWTLDAFDLDLGQKANRIR
jgi:hypothetical protein